MNFFALYFAADRPGPTDERKALRLNFGTSADLAFSRDRLDFDVALAFMVHLPAISRPRGPSSNPR
jgi:hypothetical protein